MSENTAKKVCVGLSGGVDSSVTALILKEAGYQVTGVFIRAWRPDFVVCSEAEDRLDAMRVAAHLEIPFITLDAQEAYRKEVVDAMIQAYKQGLTPNPDMLCNKQIKFGVFEKFRNAHGFDYLATGHYARITHDSSATRLFRGVDEGKDQSYFLADVAREALTHALFPLGALTKSEVRVRAERAQLPTAHKRDSQGVCFLGDVNMPEFLSHFIESTPGNVVTPNGTVVGQHEGLTFYTIGQRHGFTRHEINKARTPYYVIEKDPSQNTLIVDTTHPTVSKGSARILTHYNHISPTPLGNKNYSAVFRYHGATTEVQVEPADSGVIVTLLTDSEATSPGQTCVLYDGEEVVGGGIIGHHE